MRKKIVLLEILVHKLFMKTTIEFIFTETFKVNLVSYNFEFRFLLKSYKEQPFVSAWHH